MAGNLGAVIAGQALTTYGGGGVAAGGASPAMAAMAANPWMGAAMMGGSMLGDALGGANTGGNSDAATYGTRFDSSGFIVNTGGGTQNARSTPTTSDSATPGAYTFGVPTGATQAGGGMVAALLIGSVALGAVLLKRRRGRG